MTSIGQSVEDAKRVIAEIGEDRRRSVEHEIASVQGCAMCGGPVSGDEVLCAKCQGIVKGPG